ncbi:MAG: Uma2 family endonuclease [Saprospiraceae bacterium]|nr:Uma2 family endonuclease [Saprospiraceae bacterium]
MVSIDVIEKIYTHDEYLALEERAEGKHEFVNGKIIEMSGASAPHNLIAMSIGSALKVALRGREKKHFVMGSDMKIRIEAINQTRYPDALVICDKLEFYKKRTDVITNPLLIVEVLSRSTEDFDRTLKFEEYKFLPSFKEYVLIHQDRPFVTTYFREEEELWRVHTTMGTTENIYFKSIDCQLNMADIYEDIVFE